MRLPILVILFLLGILISCENQKQATAPKATIELEYNSYEADWKKVETLEQKGLAKSIVPVVDSILMKALKEENAVQTFKALAYRSKYVHAVEEDASFKIIQEFERKIEEVNQPTKALLQSATAELYSQYHQREQWRINQRTNTLAFDPKDLKSWTADQLIQQSSELYQASLAEADILSSYPLEAFKEMLNPFNQGAEHVYDALLQRPSLYEFLAQRALDFYARNYQRKSLPFEAYEPADSFIFQPLEAFRNASIKHPDSLSKAYLSLQLYQEILTQTEKAKHQSALLDFSLSRLQYAKSISYHEDKDSLYLASVKSLLQEYDWTEEEKREIMLVLAEAYSQTASAQEPLKNKSSNASSGFQKALEICKQYGEEISYAGKRLLELAAQIEAIEFQTEFEHIYLPNKSILYFLRHKNLDSLYFELYQVPLKFENGFSYNQQENIDLIKKQKQIKKWAKAIPNPKDYYSHNSELFIEPQAVGRYALLIGNKKGMKQGIIHYATFSVSELGPLNRSSSFSSKNYFRVLHRETGVGIEKVKIDLIENRYNRMKRKQEQEKIASLFTNQNGEASFENLDGRSFSLLYSKGKDSLDDNLNYYNSRFQSQNRVSLKSHHYTDRAIYRPGQTVKVKGMLVQSQENNHLALAKQNIELRLIDANGQEVASRNLKTNSYGSYHYTFTLPTGKLNGNFRIQDQYGTTYIQVEEYKRPSFYLELEKPTSQVRLNDQVTLKGIAKTFSGIPLGGIDIQFRVFRKATYPYWSYLRSFIPPSENQEIKIGGVKTKADGSFEIQFQAKALKGLKAAWQTVYNYNIQVEANRLNGETQGTESTLQLSEQSLFLSSNLSEWTQLKELQDLVINTKNISGKNISTKAQLRLNKLQSPKQVQKSSLWAEVDLPMIEKSEKKKRFPDYPIKTRELANLKVETEVLSNTIDCNQTLKLFNDLKQGAYELIVETEDAFGRAVKYQKRFVLYKADQTAVAFPTFFTFLSSNGTVKVGEKAEILLASGLKNLPLLFEVEQKGEIIYSEKLILNKSQKLIEFAIQEKHRGGISFHISGIHSNRLISKSQRVNVPFDHKKLNIKLHSFRNITEPGNKEKWSASITDYKGQGIKAELLASMYDQSLDAFSQHNWNLNLYQQQQTRLYWNSFGFGKSSSRQLLDNRRGGPYSYRHYPTLNWFGLVFNYFNRGNIAYARPLMSVSMEADNQVQGIVEKSDIARNAARSENSKSFNPSSNIKVEARKDFRETVFFYPQLESDKSGKVNFSFQMPEALSQWRFQALAHTEDLKFGLIDTSIQTQKTLMVSLGAPRYFRSGDLINLKVEVQNASNEEQKARVSLKFYNATNNKIINLFEENSGDQFLAIAPKQGAIANWKIKIPEGIQAIKYEAMAESETHSDGESKTLAVLSNQTLVTETLPFILRNEGKHNLTFQSLAENDSKTLVNESFVLEYAQNPAWYAVQALPYLSQGDKENSEQVFHRLYANLIARQVIDENPQIEAVFKLWRDLSPTELTSKLEQNQALKNVLIEETPWLQEAKDESEQKQRIALLFEVNQLQNEVSEHLKRLKELQLEDGSWPWYSGLKGNWQITQLIVEGFGTLKKLGSTLIDNRELDLMLGKAIQYLDEELEEDYQKMIHRSTDRNANHLSNKQIQALYARSFFPDIPYQKEHKAHLFYINQSKVYWQKRSFAMQAKIALILNRLNEKSLVPNEILLSIKDHSIEDEKKGMYWKSQTPNRWQNHSISNHTVLIEAFKEISKDEKSVNEMKVWLLNQKRLQNWGNSIETAKACYALLGGGSLLAKEEQSQLKVGNEAVSLENASAGLGYVKQVWKKEAVNNTLASIEIEKSSNQISWGGAYWQYTEAFDQVRESGNEEIQISKQVFKEVSTNEGPKIIPVEKEALKVGDKIVVRLRIESQLNFEFMHLKDQNAAAFEPVFRPSGVAYQDGLSYYQSSKDASTNFYFDYLPKGVYVFEYRMRVNQSGAYSSGISKIQSYYAPEFSANSAGSKIAISE